MDLSTHPIAIQGVDLLTLQKAFALEFGYGSASPLQYRHSYRDGTTRFTVMYDGDLPDSIHGTPPLHQLVVDGRPVYFFSASIAQGRITEHPDAGTMERIRQDVIQQRQHRMEPMPARSSGTPVPPQTAAATTITLPEIAERLTQKRYLFFTGAGLSASVVPEWNGLMALMGYQQTRTDNENLADTLHAIQHRLPALLGGLDAAHHAFIAGKPTAGHQAIAAMGKRLHRPVLTDNRDLIQQGAGLQAVHVNQLTPFSGASQPPVACHPKDIDGVIVCGMGGDRRGFVQWLKAHNPQAEIIHMDLAPSPTVGADRFVQGDLQVLLPQLQREVALQASHAVQTQWVAQSQPGRG
jgi:hypothetical protein